MKTIFITKENDDFAAAIFTNDGKSIGYGIGSHPYGAIGSAIANYAEALGIEIKYAKMDKEIAAAFKSEID